MYYCAGVSSCTYLCKVCVSACVCMHVCRCVHVCACMCVGVCMHVCRCVHACVCMHVCASMCVIRQPCKIATQTSAFADFLNPLYVCVVYRGGRGYQEEYDLYAVFQEYLN